MSPAELTRKVAKAIPGKEHLGKAFEELKSLSASLSSFTHKWEDLENHLASLQSSIDLRLEQLRPPETHGEPALSEPPDSSESTELTPSAQPSLDSSLPSAPLPTPRPELLALCHNMDGRGLLKFVWRNHSIKESIKDEVCVAIRSAPDPAQLVLTAVTGFYHKRWWNPPVNSVLHLKKRSCVTLLELLGQIQPEVSLDIASEVKKIARVWKDRIPPRGIKEIATLPAQAFIKLITAYGVAAEFDSEELLDVVVRILKKQAVPVLLLRRLGLEEHIHSLIEKLISNRKLVSAAATIHDYNLEEKYPLLPLIKNHVKEVTRIANEARKEADFASWNEATCIEIGALQSAISVIIEYELESEYPTEPLQNQIDTLTKVLAGRKKSKAAAARLNSKRKRKANKHSRAPIGDSLPAVVADSTTSPLLNQPQPYMVDQVSYLGSAGSYDMPGGGLYDRVGSSLLEPSVVRGSRLSPSKSYLPLHESYIPSNSFERALAYDRPLSYDPPPLSFDRLAAYDRRPTAYERPPGYGMYSLS